MEALKKYFAWLFYKLGFSADLLTFLGLALATLAGVMVYQGHFFYAGTLLLLSGFLDLMDGAVARLSGKEGVFGGILDSVLDRYGDGIVWAGVLFYCARTGREAYAILAFSAMLGSFAISYVRARAECAIPSCRVGFWERGERIVTLSLGLIFHNLGMALWVLGVATHSTVFQRLYFAKNGRSFTGRKVGSRLSLEYAGKVAGLLFFLLFFRPAF